MRGEHTKMISMMILTIMMSITITTFMADAKSGHTNTQSPSYEENNEDPFFDMKTLILSENNLSFWSEMIVLRFRQALRRIQNKMKIKKAEPVVAPPVYDTLTKLCTKWAENICVDLKGKLEYDKCCNRVMTLCLRRKGSKGVLG